MAVTTITIKRSPRSPLPCHTVYSLAHVWEACPTLRPDPPFIGPERPILRINQFMKSFFRKNDIHTRADLDRWCDGPRNKLYTVIKKNCPQHWEQFLDEGSAKATVRANYEKELTGYKCYKPGVWPVAADFIDLKYVRQYTRAYETNINVGQIIRYSCKISGYMFCRITRISSSRKSFKKEDGILGPDKCFYPTGIPNKTNKDSLNTSRVLHIVS